MCVCVFVCALVLLSDCNSRIGRRVLAEQHIAFHEQYYSPDDFAQTDIGSVSLNCDGVELAHSVFNRVRNIAKSSYACAPTLEITTEGNTNIPYIPVRAKPPCFLVCMYVYVCVCVCVCVLVEGNNWGFL